jgi:hypothetical protein
MKNDVTSGDPRLSLGGPDAWEEIEGDNLAVNFLPVRQFHEISDGQKSFLSGRRGSGKSAIGRMLARESDRAYSRPIEGEKGEYGEYMNIVNQLTQDRDAGHPVNIKESIRRLWAWALPVVAMQTIVTLVRDSGQSDDEEVRPMREYLGSLPHGLNADSSIGHLLSHTFRHAREHLAEGGFQTALLDLVNSRGHVEAVRSLQKKTGRDRRESVLLVFDTLESYRMFQPYMIEGLQGVLEAITAFLADPQMSGVSIKFFIPSEIYDRVIAGFPGKVQSRTVFLRWRTADLMTMLARRFLAVLQRIEGVPELELERLKRLVDVAYKGNDGRHLRTEFWYDTGFLPRKIKNRLGKEEDTFAYILRHTMRRPRDLITAEMQSIINAAASVGELPKISPASVVSGVHDPISLLQILKESLAPYEDDFPTELVAAAQGIFFNRPLIMKGRELKKFAKELYGLHAPENIDPEAFVTALLRCGVVGLLDEDAEAEPSALYFKAHFEHLMQGNLPLSDHLKYCVHPVMADAFNMRRFDLERAVYPMPSDGDLWLENVAEI